MDDKFLKILDGISKTPKRGTDAYKRRLKQKELMRFLLDTSRGEIPLFVSYKGAYINSVFLPLDLLKGKYIEDLTKWDFGPEDSWAYDYSRGKKSGVKNASVLSPFVSSKSRLLRKATPIVIIRNFEGMVGPKSYTVINQLLSHPNDLHFEKQRSAYCRLNEDGEVEDVVRIRHKAGENIVTISQDTLDKHLLLTKSALARFFDIALLNDRRGLEGSVGKESGIQDKRHGIFARIFTSSDKELSRLRGFQIIYARPPGGHSPIFLNRRFNHGYKSPCG